MRKSPYLPFALKIAGRKILVVGGGEVAARKLNQINGRGGIVTVVAPKIHALIASQAAGLNIKKRPFSARDMKGQDLVMALTDDAFLNEKIIQMCEKKKILCVSATGRNQSLLGMALIEKMGLQIAVGTSGTKPGLAKKIKKKMQKYLSHL